MRTFRCRCCCRRFESNPKIKGNKQHYCNSQKCQNKRKNKWARHKYKRNELFRKEKLGSNSALWITNSHSEYQRKYRKIHPEYVEKCKEKQRENYKKRVKKQAFENIVNPDALRDVNISERELCVMYRVKKKNLVNPDALSLYNTELQSFMSIKPQFVFLL